MSTFLRENKVLKIVLSLVMLAVMAAGLSACAPAAEKAKEPAIELQLFAANSLEKALPEIQDLYMKSNSNVTFKDTQFKGSGDLVTLLKDGAVADLLITASKATMDDAAAANKIVASSRKDIFQNDLVIIKKTGSTVSINSLADVSKFASVGIGDAALVPAGAYANQSLNSIGLYTSDTGKDGTYTAAFNSKVKTAASVGAVAKLVTTGDAEIAFVYSSDIYRYDGVEIAYTVPADSHKKIVYPGAVLTGANESAAADFLKFATTDAAAIKIWEKYGFQLI